MRTLTGTERTDVSDSTGHWVFAYLEVTDDAGDFVNLGALSVGGTQLDFFNTATISDNIDANTLSFSATMKREIGTASLSPFRTDSMANESGVTPGTYAPRMDLHRQWRVMGAVVPRGVTPALPSGYTELAAGIVDKITIDGLQDTITVEGRGMEADLLDAFVVEDRSYSLPMETAIQSALDDQMGSGVVSLYTPVSPSFFVDDTIGDINLMPALSDIAALTGWSLRYRYDASDVNRLTLFEPNRSATVPDWTIADTEYEDLTAEIDLANVRNYIKVNYTDATAGASTIIAPGAESGTVSCTSQSATFSVSQAAVLADGAIIVVDDVGYTVSAFNGTTGCTLVGAPDFSGKTFYTSASITQYGLRVMVIDLASGSQITTDTAAQNLADAVLSDLESPLLVQTLKAPGLWFVQLHDYVQTSANGVHYNADQFGGVTSYSHEFSDGMLTTTVGLAGSPKGRYTTWKRIGSGASASIVLPVLDYVSAQFYDSGSYVGISPFGAFIYSAYGGAGCVSIRVEHGTDPSFATATVSDWAGSPVLDGFSLTSSADRDLTYFFRFTPYSGPLVSGAVSGRAGTPEVRQVYVPPVPTNSSSVSFSRSVSGELTATVDTSAITTPIVSALNSLCVPLQLLSVPEDDQWLALTTIPNAETEVGVEYRQQYYAAGAGSVRIGANIKTLTGNPTIGGIYTVNSFVNTAALTSFAPSSTGVQYGAWVAMPTLAQTDIGVTWTVANGAGTAALDLYRVWLEFRAGTYVPGMQSAAVSAAGRASASASVTSISGAGGGCGVVLSTIYDDNFDCGSSIDTTGSRFSGANAWTAYHISDGPTPASNSQSSSLLTLNYGSYLGGGCPRAYLQSLPGGSGDWRFRLKFNPLLIVSSFPGIGIMLRESGTDKLLCGTFTNGSFEARRISSWGTWFANYTYGAIGGGVGTDAWMEVERISGNIEFRMTLTSADGDDLTTAISTGGSTGSHAQTADFTTAPDQIGLFVVDDNTTFDWFKKIL